MLNMMADGEIVQLQDSLRTLNCDDRCVIVWSGLAAGQVNGFLWSRISTQTKQIKRL